MLSSQLARALLAEALGPDDVAVRWRKGSHLTVWILRLTDEGPVLVGYGLAHRNWRRDALHRDIFTMLELDAASKGYERAVLDLALEIVYPVEFKRLRDEGPKKITRPTGDLYRSAVPLSRWNKKQGKKLGLLLTPEKKPDMPPGMDRTKPAGIKR
jgi:hypothetical protein